MHDERGGISMRKRGMARGASAASCSLGWCGVGVRGNSQQTAGLAAKAGTGFRASGQHIRQPRRRYHGAKPMRSRTAPLELACPATSHSLSRRWAVDRWRPLPNSLPASLSTASPALVRCTACGWGRALLARGQGWDSHLYAV